MKDNDVYSHDEFLIIPEQALSIEKLKDCMSKRKMIYVIFEENSGCYAGHSCLLNKIEELSKFNDDNIAQYKIDFTIFIKDGETIFNKYRTCNMLVSGDKRIRFYAIKPRQKYCDLTVEVTNIPVGEYCKRCFYKYDKMHIKNSSVLEKELRYDEAYSTCMLFQEYLRINKDGYVCKCRKCLENTKI